MTYDKMDWHCGSNFPADLPSQNGGTHIGMFLAWIILHGMAGDELVEECSDQLAAVRDRRMTGREFLIECCDARLWDVHMNEHGNRFAAAYYQSDFYLDDYCELPGAGLETLYHVKDSWENYDMLAPRISQRFEAFVSRRTAAVGPSEDQLNPDSGSGEIDSLAAQWEERKSAMMSALLGREHDHVMHALIPYAIGGGLDLYYYPNGLPGTAIATKEVCELPGEGSSNKVFENYELVMFTRETLALDDASDPSTQFGCVHQSINAVLNCIARYSCEATLNPRETCEFPHDMDDVGGKCLIFDAFGSDGSARSEFGLLLVMEIYRAEMVYAQRYGGQLLIGKLKAAGCYPYSDLGRRPVVGSWFDHLEGLWLKLRPW